MSSFSTRLLNLGYDSYDEYLTSDHWISFSTNVRAKSCFVCGYCSQLAVHHITYDNLGNETAADVITVCRKCHNGIHGLVNSGRVHLSEAHFVFKPKKSRKVKKRMKWLDRPDITPEWVEFRIIDKRIRNELVKYGYAHLDGVATIRGLSHKYAAEITKHGVTRDLWNFAACQRLHNRKPPDAKK